MSPWKVKERLQKMGSFQPMNIFLRQEIDRMQRVLNLVRSTLTELKLAVDGTIIMSDNLRDALDCMFDARIPARWKKASIVLLLLCERLESYQRVTWLLCLVMLSGDSPVFKISLKII